MRYSCVSSTFRNSHGAPSAWIAIWPWSAVQSVPAEIRLYNQLFSNPSPNAGNFAADLNPQSLEILPDARIEVSVAESNATEPWQFERQGYFVRDKDSRPGKPVFSRTIGLRDTFAKEVAKG